MNKNNKDETYLNRFRISIAALIVLIHGLWVLQKKTIDQVIWFLVGIYGTGLLVALIAKCILNIYKYYDKKRKSEYYYFSFSDKLSFALVPILFTLVQYAVCIELSAIEFNSFVFVVGCCSLIASLLYIIANSSN